MKHFKYLSLALLLTLFSAVAYAGAGHSHEPVSQAKAEQIASRIVTNMVRQGVIEQSWEGRSVAKSETKTFGGQREWVISYHNPTITDEQKQTLYVFLTLSGEYLAANYSGE